MTLVAAIAFMIAGLAVLVMWWQQRNERKKIDAQLDAIESQQRRIRALSGRPSHIDLVQALSPDQIVVPDEEIVEPIHMMLSPHQMACGTSEGIGVFGFESSRVTCEMCREWMTQNRGLGAA